MQKKRQRRTVSSIVLRVGALLMGLYLVLQLMLNQMSISSKRSQLDALQDQLNTQTAQNQELADMLENGDELELIERVARDTMGYAKPNERVFVDMSGK